MEQLSDLLAQIELKTGTEKEILIYKAFAAARQLNYNVGITIHSNNKEEAIWTIFLPTGTVSWRLSSSYNNRLINITSDSCKTYIDYVKTLRQQEDKLLSFVNRSTGILWIYGDGSNGKTTMINAIIKDHNIPVIHIGENYYPEDYVDVIGVRIMRDITKLTPQMLSDMEESNNQFIIESNQPPPIGLDCEVIEMTHHYK